MATGIRWFYNVISWIESLITKKFKGREAMNQIKLKNISDQEWAEKINCGWELVTITREGNDLIYVFRV